MNRSLTGQDATSIKLIDNPPPMQVLINLNAFEIWNLEDRSKSWKSEGNRGMGLELAESATKKSVPDQVYTD